MSRVILVALVALATGCTASPAVNEPSPALTIPTAPTVASAPPTVTGAPAGTALPSAVATAAPTIPAAVDEQLVQTYEAAGLDPDAAVFLALTSVSVGGQDARHYVVSDAFPTGNSAQISIALTPGPAPDTGSAPLVVQQVQTTPSWTFHLAYFVPYSALPNDLVQELQTGAPLSANDVMLAAFVSSNRSGDRPDSGVNVVVDGVVDQFKSDVKDRAAERIDEELGGHSAGNLLAGIEALESVDEAFSIKKEYEEFDKQLNELRDCAENPTNPITQNGYRDDPTQKQRILDAIESARTEIKQNTAVSFIGQLNKTGSGLVANAKWLGYIVGPATAWAADSLKAYNQKLVDDVKKGVTPCIHSYKLDQTFSYDGLTLHYTSLKCDGPSGKWTIDMKGGGSGLDFAGTITFTLPEGADGQTLTGDLTDEMHLGAGPAGADGKFPGKATFIPGSPPKLQFTEGAGTVTGYSGGYALTGSFFGRPTDWQLEVGDFCKSP
jgi:hypothetical protein